MMWKILLYIKDNPFEIFLTPWQLQSQMIYFLSIANILIYAKKGQIFCKTLLEILSVIYKLGSTSFKEYFWNSGEYLICSYACFAYKSGYAGRKAKLLFKGVWAENNFNCLSWPRRS